MSERIEPALTAEEWAKAFEAFANAPHPETLASGLGEADPVRRALSRVRYERDEARLRVKLIALENAALPEGHPNRLTREDVDTLSRLARPMESGDCWPFDGDDAADVRSLAAKLAALLPPREG